MDLFRSPKFSSRAEELIKKQHVPGIAIAIVQDDEIASAGYGLASLHPEPKPCTADTLFDIASASKSLTAASVALLVNDDEKYPEVQYDAKMCDLLPGDFVMSEEAYTRDITLDDVLSHRTGLANHDNSYFGLRAERPDDARSVTRNLRNLTMAAPIRSKYMYCNMMFTVATYLVEKKTGRPFNEFLRERFFEPLGMDSSSLQPEEARARGLGSRIASGHAWDKDGGFYHQFPYQDCPEGQGAGSIITSVNDYAKYVRAMMNRNGPFSLEGVYQGLVRQRTFQNPDAKNLPPLTSPTAYAAGWEVYYYRGYAVVGHDGCIPGSATRHFFLPELHFGGAIFGNDADGAYTVISVLVHELIDEVLAVPEAERPDWEKIETEEQDEENQAEKLRLEMCQNAEAEQQQTVPLHSYVGKYNNAGYHEMSVGEKDGKLFISAMDRSLPFTMSFDHVCDQTKYIVHAKDYFGSYEYFFKAEFKFEADKVVKMGLDLDDDIKDWVWFDKI